MKTETYRPLPGEHIDRAIQHASRLSKDSHCRVRFQFNDVTLEATPKKSPATILWEWNNTNNQRASIYRNSKEGQDAKRRRAIEIAKKQDAITAAIRGLPGLLALKNLDCTMGWLNSFTEDSDDIGIDFDKAAGLISGGLEWIAVLFEANGFKENDLVGEPQESFNTRERIGKYIAGQAINCLRRGMPPHPVTQSFVEKYFALPA